MGKEQEKKLRQSGNVITIEGWVNSVDIEESPDKSGKEKISGTVEIRTNETNIIPVELFSYKLTKEGKENSIFKGIQTIAKEYKTASQVEKWEDADKVRVGNGEIRINEYVGRDKEIHSAVRYSTNFVNRVKDNFKPQSTFSCEIVYRGEREELKNDESTGRGFIDGYIVDYSGNLKPVSFLVNKKVWKKAEGAFEKGETLYVTGDILSVAETKIIKIEMEFGDDEERVVTRRVRERLITGIKRVEEDKTYEKDDLNKAAKQREKFLEELKAKAEFAGDDKRNNDDEDPDGELPF